VQELDQQKLTRLLRLKYNNSIADAVAHLGNASPHIVARQPRLDHR
jgi:hypothetical protein